MFSKLQMSFFFWGRGGRGVFVPGHPHAIPVHCTLLSALQTAHTWWCVIHSPFHSCREKCVARWTQIHGKHGSAALLSSFPLLLVVVLAEHGGWLSSVDRHRWIAYLERARSSSTRVWNSWVVNLERARSSSERVWDSLDCISGTSAKLVGTSVRFVAGWRWNERGTRCWSHSKVADCPWLLVVTQSHHLERSLDPEPLALVCEPTQPQWKMQCELCNSRWMLWWVRTLHLKLSWSVSQQNIAQGLA